MSRVLSFKVVDRATAPLTILQGGINTLNATNWTLFKARWLGAKEIKTDNQGKAVHLRRYQDKVYFIGRVR